MGYDLRLHIGEISTYGKGTKKDPTYFMENSRVELCCIDSELHDLLDKSEKRARYVFIYLDGDTKTIEDNYGARLRAVPAHLMLRHLKK